MICTDLGRCWHARTRVNSGLVQSTLEASSLSCWHRRSQYRQAGNDTGRTYPLGNNVYTMHRHLDPKLKSNHQCIWELFCSFAHIQRQRQLYFTYIQLSPTMRKCVHHLSQSLFGFWLLSLLVGRDKNSKEEGYM